MTEMTDEVKMMVLQLSLHIACSRIEQISGKSADGVRRDILTLARKLVTMVLIAKRCGS